MGKQIFKYDKPHCTQKSKNFLKKLYSITFANMKRNDNQYWRRCEKGETYIHCCLRTGRTTQ